MNYKHAILIQVNDVLYVDLNENEKPERLSEKEIQTFAIHNEEVYQKELKEWQERTKRLEVEEKNINTFKNLAYVEFIHFGLPAREFGYEENLIQGIEIPTKNIEVRGVCCSPFAANNHYTECDKCENLKEYAMFISNDNVSQDEMSIDDVLKIFRTEFPNSKMDISVSLYEWIKSKYILKSKNNVA